MKRISAKHKAELALRKSIKLQLIRERGYKCEECGVVPWHPPLGLSHTLSLARGGKTTMENCRLLCQKCHAKEHHLRVVDSNPMFDQA